MGRCDPSLAPPGCVYDATAPEETPCYLAGQSDEQRGICDETGSCIDPEPPIDCAIDALIIYTWASEHGPDNPPELTLNGDVTSNGGWWAAQGNGQWIAYELSQAALLEYVRFSFYASSIRYFSVETSLDGEDWTMVLAEQESQGDNPNAFERFDFEPVCARFLRFVGHGSNVSGPDGWNAIVETDINGFVVDLVECRNDDDCAPDVTSPPYCHDGDVFVDVQGFTCESGECVEHAATVLEQRCLDETECRQGACQPIGTDECTVTADSAELVDVTAAIATLSHGDILCVPATNTAGNPNHVEWDSELVIDKAITLRGAGSGIHGGDVTHIRQAINDTYYSLIRYVPDEQSMGRLFRVTGFMFDNGTEYDDATTSNSSAGIRLANSDYTSIAQVRVDDCSFYNFGGVNNYSNGYGRQYTSAVQFHGLFEAVIDSCYFYQCRTFRSNGDHPYLLGLLGQPNGGFGINAADMRQQESARELVGHLSGKAEDLDTLVDRHQRASSIGASQKQSIHAVLEHPAHVPLCLLAIQAAVLSKYRYVGYDRSLNHWFTPLRI